MSYIWIAYGLQCIGTQGSVTQKQMTYIQHTLCAQLNALSARPNVVVV